MKIKSILAMAAAVIITLTSCSKDENGKNENQEAQNLTIHIDGESDQQSAGGESRAATDPAIEAGNDVEFNEGKLYLTTSAGKIVDIYSFSSTSATDVSNNILSISDAKSSSGVNIPVHNSIKMAYIVGNASLITDTNFHSIDVGDNISDVKSTNITPKIQYDSQNGGLAKVTLYGEAEVVSNPADQTKKIAEITLRPHVARIEVSDIKGGSSILSFDLDGIYVNNYYETMNMDYTIPTNSLTDNGQGGHNVYGAGKSGYDSSYDKIIYDNDPNGHFNNLATSLTKTPDGNNPSSKVWAYNLLAAPIVSGHSTLGTGTTAAPRLIVKVSGLTPSDPTDTNNYSAMNFITVKRFIDQGGDPIEHFEAGKIYTIEAGDFVFELDDVLGEAETETVELTVKVALIKWTTEKIKPEL